MTTATTFEASEVCLRLGIQAHKAGKLDAARCFYQRILSAEPDHPEANHLLGLLSYQQGAYGDAIRSIRRAIENDPDFAPYHLNLGNALQESGDLDAAVSSFRRAAELDARLDVSLYNLANALQGRGDVGESIAVYRSYLAAHPDHAEARQNLGHALQKAGRVHEAIECFQRALELDPRLSSSYASLGLLLQESGDPDGAVLSHEKYLALHPDNAPALYVHGIACLAAHLNKKAATSLKKAIRIDPTVPEFYYGLGDALGRLRRYPQSDSALSIALRLRPGYLAADQLRTIHATGWKVLSDSEAEEIVQRSKSWPDVRPMVSVGCNLVQAGRYEQGLEVMDRAQSLQPGLGHRLKLATVLPTILRSSADIEFWRRRFECEVDRLLSDLGSMADPLREVGKTNFYLAYHSRNDRALQQKIANLYVQACPSLAWVAPHCCRPVPRKPARRRKVGFLSFHLRHHTIGKLNRGLIRNLDRDRFHVTVLQVAQPGETPDAWAKEIAASADRAVTLTGSLADMRSATAAEELDVLFYTDIGMDPITYFLAFSRLAPVQCVTWGHPVTTGIPSMDYFISSADLDLPTAQDHYSETLIRLPHVAVCYHRPKSPDRFLRTLLREHVGRRLYVCVQSLFKLHPDFDRVLGSILRGDPEGLLVFIEGQEAQMGGQLRERFARTMPDVSGRIVFVPRLSGDKFTELLKISDVLLDTPYFGGGNTSWEAFAAGAPVVTMERPLMRERITPVLYRMMGVTDLIAESGEHYAQLALRCATDRPWRDTFCARIAAASDRIFEQQPGIRELEEFFDRAIEAAQTGRRLDGWIEGTATVRTLDHCPSRSPGLRPRDSAAADRTARTIS